MNFANCRICAIPMIAFCFLLFGRAALAQPALPAAPLQPAAPERIVNGGFECKEAGYRDGEIPDDANIDSPNRIPNGWEFTYTLKSPIIDSARIHFAGSCDGSAHVERIEGEDSVLMQALDLEWTDEPGKPFDASLYQQIGGVVSGTAYSLSGWMLTLCGGSNTNPRNDCPEEYYMSKQLGIDPTGGTDPNASTVEWTRNRRNFVRADGVTRYGWQNLRLGVTAEAVTITVFARIDSPFRWHGNHGFIDAISLLQAPVSSLAATAPLTGSSIVTLTWTGDLGPDIPAIAGGKHALLFDVDYWHAANDRWRTVVEDAAVGAVGFDAACTSTTYRFRVRARAEQPDGEGIQPNQRYNGVWSEPIDIFVPAPPLAPAEPLSPTNQLFLPDIRHQPTC